MEYKFIGQLKSLAFIDVIYLYGSRARGDHRERSDIDLAVLCPTATDMQWNQVMEIIEEADTLLKIDCIRLDQISDENLIHNIERDRQTLHTTKE